MTENAASSTGLANEVDAAPSLAVGAWQTFHESPPAAKALLLGMLINKLGAFMQVFLVLYVTWRGYSAVAAGVALGLHGAGSVLGVIAGGSFSDRLGPRLTIVASMVGQAVLLVGVLYVHSYIGLLITITLVGAVGQLYRPAAAALLVELTSDERQVMVFAMYRLAMNIGTTVAPLLGAALVAVSYQVLFWGEALASLAYGAIALIALPRSRTADDAPSQPTSRGSGLAADAAPAAKRGGMAGYRAVFADRRYLAYIIAMFINSAVYVQYLSTLPLAVTAAGLSTIWYSVMVAINGGVVICFELMMTTLTQHQPIRKVLRIGFPLLGLGMAMYSIPAGVAVFVIGTLLWSLAEIIEGPSMFAYPGRAAPRDLTGRYVASAHAMFGLGTSIGPMIGVLLWSTLGSVTWLIVGAASVLGLIPALWGVTPSRAEVGRQPATVVR